MPRKLRESIFWKGVIALAVISAIQFHAFVEERILLRPRRLPTDHAYHFPGQRFTEHWLDSPEGDRLNLLHFYAADSLPRRGLILYSHGNADHLQRWGAEAHHFTTRGYDIVFWDYRGFGKSTGWLNQARLLDDAERVYEFARKLNDTDSLVLYGRSIGSGIATWLAGRRPAARLILETPYTNLHEMTRQWVPFFPAWWPLKYELRQDRWLAEVSSPVLILHGTADEVVPYAMGQALTEQHRARGRQVEFVTIPGGKHKNLPDFPLWTESVAKFLSSGHN